MKNVAGFALTLCLFGCSDSARDQVSETPTNRQSSDTTPRFGESPSEQTLLPPSKQKSIKSWSKPSGRIYFIQNHRLYSIKPSDKTLKFVKLIKAPWVFPYEVDINRDVSKIAFSSNIGKRSFASAREVSPELYISNFDGTHLKQLTNLPGCVNSNPRFNLDGDTILFQSSCSDLVNVYSLITIRPKNGKTPKLVGIGYNGDGRDASFDASGKKIVFSSLASKFISETEQGEHREISTMDIDGKNYQQLTHNVTSDIQPAWSPDGKQITFVSMRDGNSEIYVMKANGSNETRLTRGKTLDVQPVWSPDSQYIAWLSGEEEKLKINIMNADGSGQQQLLDQAVSSNFLSWR